MLKFWGLKIQGQGGPGPLEPPPPTIKERDLRRSQKSLSWNTLQLEHVVSHY